MGVDTNALSVHPLGLTVKCYCSRLSAQACPLTFNPYKRGARGRDVIHIRTSNLVVNGRQIPTSPSLSWKRGVFFCRVCGYHSVKKIVSLHDKCPKKVPSEAMRRHLNGIDKGKPSTSNGRWPQEDGCAPPRAVAKFSTPE